MLLSCPHCGFAREIDAARIPAGTARATCPRCRQGFPLEPPAPAAAPVQAPTPAAASSSDTQRQATCSACGVLQPAAERCVHCGATFIANAAAVVSYNYAGFWIRVVASLLDSVLVTAVQGVLGLLLALAAGLGGGLDPSAQGAVAAVSWMFGTALAAGYYVFFTGYCGQTPGKMALRIKVIRTDGSGLGYGRAALRELVGKFISGILLGIGYLMVAFDERKQGLHDRMADTYVIKL